MASEVLAQLLEVKAEARSLVAKPWAQLAARPRPLLELFRPRIPLESARARIFVSLDTRRSTLHVS